MRIRSLALLTTLSLLIPRTNFAIEAALLDKAAFAQWVGGSETPMAEEPKSVVWTEQGKPDWRGAKFGAGREGGARHLRIAFNQPVKVGSVLVSGGGTLSVLKAEATYPGDLADDSQWLPAERLVEGAPTRAEVLDGNYGLWVLPSGTQTRALRFSHQPAPGDREMTGVLNGMWLTDERMANVAPQALVQSRARDDVSAKVVDESSNRLWQSWDNGENGAALPVSAEHPEIVTLTWPKVVTMRDVCLLWTGFQSCEIDAFTGADDASIREAPDASWKRVGKGERLEALYPMPLGPQWIPLDGAVTTRALRLRMTSGVKSTHPHLDSKVKDGRRVWLGELMALVPLGDTALTSIVLPKASEEPPPIPVKFTLPEAGLVTLVIEDMTNHRVRNLVSEAPFPAGENIAWWDGSDDLLRDPEAANHGVYHIPTRPVAPGSYKVRGLWHKPVKLHYEFSIYSAGKPAWPTADNTGCWMTTHTPPSSMAFVSGKRTADGQPLVFMGAYVAEGGHGLQWLREDGTKIGGQHWVGGTWTGAPTLAVDSGEQHIADHLCYVGSVWDGELRLTAKTKKLEDKPIFKVQLGPDPRIKKPSDGVKPPELEGFDGGDKVYVLAGIAVRDGIIVCSMIRQNELIFVDAKAGSITGRLPVENPRGVTFDASGRMLVLSETNLLSLTSYDSKPETLITGLEDPRHVTTGANGNIFITDRGTSHQVKVFDRTGKSLRSIGKAGAPAIGDYDPLHINNPNGLAQDSQGRVWVVESDNFPRRVSVWNGHGELVHTFYGPTEYGGGGVLDPQDEKRFFYKGLEFALDWKTGADQLKRVFARPDPLLEAHGGHFSPDTPLYPSAHKGERYFTSCYTHNPTGGDNAAFIWHDDGKVVHLVAGLGSAHAWEWLRRPEFRSAWPQGTKPEEDNPPPDKHATFAWSDTSGDGKPQPDEVRMIKAPSRGVTVTRDLAFLVARFEDMTARFAPKGFDTHGVPLYELKAEKVGPAGGAPPSSGGNQALQTQEWTLTTNATAPFSPHGIGGMFKAEPRWSYPSAWPGLHASHEAAVPDRPGMVVGHTRLLGDFIQGKAGPMFCINGNMGNMYLFTADGLFVSTFFNDIRLRPNWGAPVATRNMDVTEVSLHDENFWPSITQTPNGKVFLIDGGRTSLVRVDGLDSIQRLPDQTITVTAEDLEKSRDWFARAEIARQKARGTGILNVMMRQQAPKVDGKLDDWPATTDWASIDRRGIKANFNSNSKPYEVSAAVTLSGDRLFAAWRTSEKELLNNSGETPNALFKTGGCLDLMLQADTDQRLLVTFIKGKPRAILYRAKVAGTKEPVSFGSPWRSISIDVVEDVTAQLSFAADGAGNYEISMPLAALHWQPKSGDEVRADLGVLRGSNFQTTQRIYWSNKATAITADVPSEAELTPKLWGKWRLTSE
ncbi:hypothetical protein [Brevifollis gellanilyticus]|uniref:SMP-30/Gluconolactonase/LRE-like region domain-containing protein n=1 Tax=Brevifollis gellanilyticus TaxID=748831 RepID=A0A512M692_9BACT|nr:hypothetical protein [Brevifollis gellanilyticus]GEP42257.1 hypothetical protein BGE01nite_15480 [Brevifollis gellanilyticus]